MAKKSPRPSSQPAPQPRGKSAQLDLSDAIHALREATRTLAASAVPPTPDSPLPASTPSAGSSLPDFIATVVGGNQPGNTLPPSTAIEEDSDARTFYEHLEQNGQLADVTDDTDLSTLSPRVTHVRRRDGTIERIGFSGA
ncbi:hypothetical protein SAMN05444166_3168 [Singulisphaera sp. GP187]|nr:hypothetical protein SAMN05444166_3168 [Singulisphaera sp. GP187]